MIRKYFCIISEKMKYEMLTKEIGEMFIQMEEQNVLSDTAVYISTDILIHICLYMSELGVDFSLVVEKEQRQLTGLQNNGGIEEIRSVLMDVNWKNAAYVQQKINFLQQRKK